MKPYLALYRREEYLDGRNHHYFALSLTTGGKNNWMPVGSYTTVAENERKARQEIWRAIAKEIKMSGVPAEIFWQNKAGKMAVKTCLSHLIDGALVVYKHIPPDRFFDQVEWLNNPDWCTRPMVEELLERVGAKVSRDHLNDQGSAFLNGEKDLSDEVLLQKILDKEIKIKVIEVHCLPDGTKKVEVFFEPLA